jgi:hypothetical protein
MITMFMPDPTILPLPEYREAVQAIEKYRAALDQADADVTRLNAESDQARLADDQAQAQAMVTGAKDPGRPNSKRVQAALAEATQKIGVLEQAVAQSEAAIQTLLTERTDECKAAALDGIEATRQKYLDAIAAMVEARSDFHAAGALSGWLDDTSRRFKASLPLLNVRGLVTQNGEPAPLDPILECLRAEATPPTAPERVATHWKQQIDWEPSEVEGRPLGQVVSMVPVFDTDGA